MPIPDCIPPLMRAGISQGDAFTLRRIALTLHRWHELQCGSDYGCIERDETTGPDREAGAKKRLAAVMARYPALTAYVQGDPRGAALYILRPGDVLAGSDVNCCYSRGLAVYK